MQFYSDHGLWLLGLKDELNKRKYHIIDDVDDITPNMRRVCIKKTITKSVPSYITHVKTDVALWNSWNLDGFNQEIPELPPFLQNLQFGHDFNKELPRSLKLGDRTIFNQK